MTDYADLSDEDQAEALRPVALEAARRFGLDVDRLEVHTHSYNTTYALTTPEGRRVALRLGTSSTSDAAAVLVQQEWQVALAAETDVSVPVPLQTTDGGWVATVPSEALGRDVLVTCAGWLEGDDVGRPDTEVAHALGRTMALMHRHARSWALPPGAALRRLDTPLFGDEDRLTGAPGLGEETRDVLARARALCDDAFARAFASAEVVLLHADLHGHNLKWHEGRLAVLDFDDAGLAVPALDLAVSAFYLRSGDAAPEEALRAGYAEVAPLPDVAPDVLEALVASRQLLLANDLLTSSTAQWRDRAQDYLGVSVHRLGHWLATGRFTLAPPA